MPTTPQRVALSALNGRTVDIINTIRSNASAAYRDTVPAVHRDADGDALRLELLKVGESLRGYPAFANEFLSALMNRIGLVTVKSMNFYNEFKFLKKGELSFGETVEEVFVQIARVRALNPDKAAKWELQRNPGDVRAAFHVINWQTQYFTTIQHTELYKAFTTLDGVTDMIARLVGSLNGGLEVDDWFMFKYLVARGILNGSMKPVQVVTGGDEQATAKNLAKVSRQMSRMISNPSTEYNFEGVITSTPPERQVIILDAEAEANLDVEVLSHAFNMDRSQLNGRLIVVDSFSTFPADRYNEVTDGKDPLVPAFTTAELAVLGNVRAVVVDADWFQVYDKTFNLGETVVASGMYTNYFLNVEKIFSISPFANALAFVEGNVTANPGTFTVTVSGKSESEISTVFSLETNGLPQPYRYVQTDEASTAGVGIHPYGGVVLPPGVTTVDLEVVVGEDTYTGALTAATAEGAEITFTKGA